jgi:hypothetical protein
VTRPAHLARRTSHLGTAAVLCLLLAPALRADTNAPPPEPPAAEPPADFEPLEDRWRIEPPPYERNVRGHWWDPYNQNVLKGDFPIWKDDVFFKLTAASRTVAEGRSVPLPSAVSSEDPGSFGFFGQSDTILIDQKFVVRTELFKGLTAYKPFDWQIVLEGVGNVNHLEVFETNAVDPDVREGTSRTTEDIALQEAALELHLADLSVNYDFISTKVGRQPFNSDFRSLIFSDVNQGARLFGSANGNRYQYNALYFYQAEKDTNSELNTFDARHQHLVVVNLYAQDLFVLGHQQQVSFHYNYDDGKESAFKFDNQGFLVRPDPVGAARPHNVEAFYLGWTSEGHIGWLNVSHAFYQALGHDTHNPIAGRRVDLNGQLAFLELSIDRDWMRYQASAFFTSGDDDPRDDEARGFDSILDNQKILGGEFSYWNRQSLRIADRGGVALMQRNSVIPDLRSGKIQGQSNFVNPGILMFNLGATSELTPKVRAVGNVNYIRFVETEPLELLLKQPNIRKDVGVDVSLGFEWRPFLNNNVILKPFGAFFAPVGGFTDIYQRSWLYQVGTDIALVF